MSQVMMEGEMYIAGGGGGGSGRGVGGVPNHASFQMFPAVHDRETLCILHATCR